jgi:hypothetical protein
VLSPHLDANGIEEIECLLEGLVRLDLSQLRRGLAPPIYASGVRYKREARGREDWQSAVMCNRLRTADCEDLASYAAASYRLVGVAARAIVRQVGPGLKHCLTLLPDGTIEDPSKRLGMGAKKTVVVSTRRTLAPLRKAG